MTFLNKKTYQLDPPVLLDLNNTNNLNSAYIQPEKLSLVGRYKRVRAGSWLANDSRLLPAAIVIGAYTAGETSVVVNNPWAFLPGDVLSIVGDATENAIAEYNAVTQGTAPEFGTVTVVNPGIEPFEATLTLSAIANGDAIFLKLENVIAGYSATSADISEAIKGLYDSLVTNRQESNHDLNEAIQITNNGTTLTFKAAEPGILFEINGGVTGAGSMDIAIAEGTGSLTITPGAGNADLEFGAKLRDINYQGLGIFANTMYCTEDRGLERLADNAPYDAGNIYKKSLLYLDGELIRSNPTLKYSPAYGS